MKLRWCVEKNRILKYQHGVTFGEILKCRMIDIVDHPKRPHQWKMLFEYNRYVWVVPFVVRGDEVFLKTMYPCRKYTKLYRGEIEDEKD